MSSPIAVAGAGRLRCGRGGVLGGICARCDVSLQLVGQLEEGVGAVTQGGRSSMLKTACHILSGRSKW
jgi:hypothetical protein